MRARRCLPALLLLVVSSSGCGNDAVHVRYRADRHLWSAERASERLPGRPVTTGREARLELAERFDSIGAHYADWAEGRPEGPVTDDVRRLATRARLRAVDLIVATGDSTSAERRLLALRETETGPRSLGDLERRLGEMAAVHLDSSAAAAHFATAWRHAHTDDRWRRAHLDLPLRAARMASTSDDAESVKTWARGEYDALLAGARRDESATVLMHLARLDMDAGRFHTALERLDPMVASILDQRLPEQGDVGKMTRIFPLYIRAFRFGAVSGDRLDDLLGWTIQHRGPAAPLLMETGLALEDRAEYNAALAVFHRIVRRHDDATYGPRALRETARIHTALEQWDEAFVTWKLIESKYALTDIALTVPLELERHHRMRRDESAARDALRRAEQEYRTLKERFPTGGHSGRLQELLIECLERQGRFEEAFDERLEWIDAAEGRSSELTRLHETVVRARAAMVGRERIGPLLQRMTNRFPGTRLGEWASALLEAR